MIAIGKSGSPGLVPRAQDLLADPSPLVRGMAVWALGRLLDGAEFARLKARHHARETDAHVLAEWDCVLACADPDHAEPAASRLRTGA